MCTSQNWLFHGLIFMVIYAICSTTTPSFRLDVADTLWLLNGQITAADRSFDPKDQRHQSPTTQDGFNDKPIESDKSDSADASNSDEERNAKLAKYLTQTRWTGKFTMTGREDGPLVEENYEIIEATKADEGDFWNLVARIKYGDKDVTLPLPSFEIKWAGETPVITVDKMTIPGMGTFDARVLIRKGQYAGTWSHGAVGGHMFGKIEKINDPVKPDEEHGKSADR
jgi:hypothetical protein